MKGTTSSDEGQWVENVKQLYTRGAFYLPTCVFIINVRSNETAYAWVAEQQIEDNSAKLSLDQQPHFHALDRNAVDHIVNRVREWYDAIPRSFKAQTS